jgi:hypothetical protein
VRLLASKAVIEISCGRWAHFVRPVKDLTDPPQECSSIPHRLIPYGNFPHLDRSGQSYLVVPFTVQQGTSSGLASVSVQLRNTQGTSSAGSASF